MDEYNFSENTITLIEVKEEPIDILEECTENFIELDVPSTLKDLVTQENDGAEEEGKHPFFASVKTEDMEGTEEGTGHLASSSGNISDAKRTWEGDSCSSGKDLPDFLISDTEDRSSLFSSEAESEEEFLPSSSSSMGTAVATTEDSIVSENTSQCDGSSGDHAPNAKRSRNNGSVLSSREFHLFSNNSSGHTSNLGLGSSVLDIFLLFFSEYVVDFIADETNKFYKYTTEHSQQLTYSRLSKWKNTTGKEMYCFLALCLLMGRIRKFTVNEYWSKDYLISTPIFGEVMSRDRFMLILAMLHFCDSSVPSSQDCIFKIKKLVDNIRDAYQKAFCPYEQQCIDESVLFKDRMFLKQYLPTKHSKFGINMFVLCDCQSGYVVDFIIYSEANSDKELGKSDDIVVTFLKPYLQEGRIIYIDNWHTSPAVFTWLHGHATNRRSSVRKSRRGMLKLEAKLRNKELRFLSSNILLSLQWCDQGEMWMLTSCNSSETVKSETSGRKTGEKIKTPKCAVECSEHMRAFDRSDITCSVESVRRTVKWYKKLFFHVLDLTVLNAHTLYKLVTKKPTEMKDFHLNLIREILEKYCPQRKRPGGGRRPPNDTPLRLIQRHFPSAVLRPGETQKSQRRCVICSRKKVRRSSSYMCNECNVGLCVVPCFEIYHTQKVL